MDSPFDVLGVDEDADDAEIDRAYRRRVIETHPDQGGSKAEFRVVREAYEEIKSGDGEPESESESEDGESDVEVREETAPEQVGTRVEYLDYEVVEERGWELDDDELFERAAAADLRHREHGRFVAHPSESLLEAAEERGFVWPYSCRGGACANCAVLVVDGEVEMPGDHILPDEMLERGFVLSCISTPVTEELRVVFNVKHLPGLDELRLPAPHFERAQSR